MKKAWVYAVVLSLFSVTCLRAAEGLSEEAKAKLGLAKSYVNLRQYKESIAIFKELQRGFPENEDISVELINALYAAGMEQEAENALGVLLKHRIKEARGLLSLAQTLSGKGRYPAAEAICNAILRDNPQDLDSRLWLARVLSWEEKYESSLAQYDAIIKKSPGWVLPIREKARVLGWQRRYSDSIGQYKRILSETEPKSEVTMVEMSAKRDYYNLFDEKDIGYYLRWLEMEKDDPEALSDLGQIYARQMRWEEARQTYGRLLSLYPSNERARAVLNKVNQYSKSIVSETGFSHYEADSSSRDIDEKYWDLYTKAILPISQNFYLGAGEEAVFYTPSSAKSFKRMKTSVSFEYYNNPAFWAHGEYVFSAYTGTPKDSSNYSAEINYRPVDMVLFSFYSGRQDVEDNPQTMTRNLKRDDYRIRSTFRPNRRISAGADYTYSYFTDKNNKYTYGLDAEYNISYDPRRLTLRYRYEAYGFQEPRNYYFTPGSFHYNAVGIEWRQFLNKDLFWGSNDTFYTLGYAVNFDVQAQVGNRFYANIHRDWNGRLSTHIEWSKKMYNHRDIYGDEQVTAFVKYSF